MLLKHLALHFSFYLILKVIPPLTPFGKYAEHVRFALRWAKLVPPSTHGTGTVCLAVRFLLGLLDLNTKTFWDVNTTQPEVSFKF